uniref:Uncharacterized protein n=1 Tax=Anguilla anguilla TaxID=7936 RepID=A0A0E9T569_ANGAN
MICFEQQPSIVIVTPNAFKCREIMGSSHGRLITLQNKNEIK